MVNINGPEFLVIALLAMLLVGPERLPEYVRGLRTVVIKLRSIIKEGQSTLKDELGDDIDWNQLDPRNYDPRRIVRDALFEEVETNPASAQASVKDPAGAGVTPAVVAAGASATTTRKGRRGSWAAASLASMQGLTPFDDEAT